MKILKPVLLITALVLPVSIFLFLKFFGKNQFDVPVPFESGVPEKPSDCDAEYGAPYLLPDSVFTRLVAAVGDKPLYLINFSPDLTVAKDRLFTEVSESEVGIVDEEFTDVTRHCVFLLRQPYDIVLVDRSKQIRGHYVSNNREDVDRLLIETSIILKKY